MTYLNGVNLLPSTGEWTLDVVPYRGRRADEPEATPVNTYFAPGGTRADVDFALDQLLAQFPDCGAVALVVAWFGDSADASACRIYPSTTYAGGAFEKWDGGAWVAEDWRCSGLTQNSPELVPITSNGASFVYGGTPSDASVVRCLRALKARGLRAVFYPFVLMDAPGFPWRGRIGYPGADVSAAAAAAASRFLGHAAPSQFSRDAQALTVAYSGAADDYSFRRMILHYAHLCALAGGVDLFLLGSELRGLEQIRGPSWTMAGALDANGAAVWDYPFVAGLKALADDVREVFDGAGLTKDRANLRNLVSYAADWSSWMGAYHADAPGRWPHLDALWAHEAIDLVCFDNYLPLSDWTTGDGGLDAGNWSSPRPTTVWPPADPQTIGLGLAGQPALADKAYLKANIEGGEKFDWYYADGDNLGRGFDPHGSDLQVSRPVGDRLAQTRSRYYPGQELLADKQLRWWWRNPHRAVYDAGDGAGYAPHGASTAWAAAAKPISFSEYGFPTCDRATNQPNVFFDAKSSESATPYWSVWRPAEGGFYVPREDAGLALLALQAIHEYWDDDGHNEASAQGVKMIETAFNSAWCWDARPFPVFPQRRDVWGDAGNWPSGNWIGGKGPFVATPRPDPPPTPPAPPRFPELDGQAWSVRFRPAFGTLANDHASGRTSRISRMDAPLWEIEIVYDRLAAGAGLDALLGFYDGVRGRDATFLFPVPASLGLGAELLCRFADDSLDLEKFMAKLWKAEAIVLVSVKS